MGRSDKQGGARRWNWVTPPFWKLPAGARRRAEQEARRNIRARRMPSRCGGFFWWSSWSGSSARGGLSVEKRSMERLVRRSSQSVGSPGVAPGTRTGGAALPAVSRELARPCGERRRELAGPAEGPSSAAAIPAAVATDVATRPARHLEGACNLQRSRGARSVTKAPRYKGPRTLSGSLVFEGSLFFSFE